MQGYLETANRTLATLPSKSEWDGVRTQLHELEYKLGVAQDELSTAHAQKAEVSA